jgi:hypothetical protein
MLKTLRWLSWPSALILILAAPAFVGAQGNPDPNSFKFNTGQDVVPVFEGWAKNADGSYAMWFGYYNRNYAESLVIPVGAENKIEPGAADRGQPTYFYTRTHRMGFSVTVPADFGKKELTWTLTAHGKTEKAVAWLQPEWEIDPVFGGKYQSPEALKNQAPTLALKAPSTTTVSSPLKLTATVTDDGLPVIKGRGRGAVGQETPPTLVAPKDQPEIPVNVPSLGGGGGGGGGRGRGGEPEQGVIVTWTLWRGPGGVTFAPGLQRVVKSGDAVVTATFEKPGTYVLRAKANDTHRFVEKDVTVTVTPQ